MLLGNKSSTGAGRQNNHFPYGPIVWIIRQVFWLLWTLPKNPLWSPLINHALGGFVLRDQICSCPYDFYNSLRTNTFPWWSIFYTSIKASSNQFSPCNSTKIQASLAILIPLKAETTMKLRGSEFIRAGSRGKKGVYVQIAYALFVPGTLPKC